MIRQHGGREKEEREERYELRQSKRLEGPWKIEIVGKVKYRGGTRETGQKREIGRGGSKGTERKMKTV